MNKQIVEQVLQEACKTGISEFCICPGGRNAPFVPALSQKGIKCYYWFEERSAAFFALGRSRLTEKPVGVIVTSGTAVANLLPATMEAYYTGIPLLLITADRPKRFRGSNAPQTCEQVGLFGMYAPFSQDIAVNEACDLSQWNRTSPCHLNVCFEEPLL